MAIDKEHHRLFSVCDGKAMAVVDAETGRQLATASIGDGPDAAGFDERNQLAFSSNGQDGTFSVVDAAHGYKTIESLPTEPGARTMAYDSSTGRAYVVTAEFGPRPPATAANPHPRPVILPDSFVVLVLGRK
jgi:DNA-binding beta-propeller fold protein YncE